MCPKGAADGKPLCIDRSQLCDGKPDCEDETDEEAACCKYSVITHGFSFLFLCLVAYFRHESIKLIL